MSRISHAHFGLFGPVIRTYGQIGLALILMMIVGIPLEGRAYALYIEEHGFIESISVLLHLLNAALLTAFGRKYAIKAWPAFAIVCLFFAFRELDLDKTLFSFGMLKGRFFMHPEVTSIQKVAAAGIVGLVLWSLGRIVMAYRHQFLAKLLEGSMSAWAVFLAGGLIVVSKSLDGISRKLGAWGIEMNERLVADLNVVEEVLELGIGWVILAALLALWANQRENAPLR